MVIFREPGRKEFIYQGCQSTMFATTISSVRARQMMSHGCVAFLVTVAEVPTTVSGFEDIPLVREFPNVFPSELSSMPPDRVECTSASGSNK